MSVYRFTRMHCLQWCFEYRFFAPFSSIICLHMTIMAYHEKAQYSDTEKTTEIALAFQYRTKNDVFKGSKRNGIYRNDRNFSGR